MKSVGILEDRTSWSSELVTLINMEVHGSEVVCYSRVDDAIQAIVKDGYRPDVWLVDIMMPTGSILNDKETASGLATGERFILDFLELRENTGPMVLVHSQKSGVHILPSEHPRLLYMPKADFSQVEVAVQVGRLLKIKC